MDGNPTPRTVAEILELIGSRQALPSEVLAPFVRQAEALDGDLHAYITPLFEQAQLRARELDDEIKAGNAIGPLGGVPYSLKDVIETACIRTTAHSRSLANYAPTVSADVHVALEKSGAVLTGKVATWEFAHGGPSWDVLQEPACNPWNTTYDPSGSSSGSAVGVAAGFFPASIGTDTGGSVRAPAAACGVVGLKPTAGSISGKGVISNSFSLDTVGPLAWSSEDVAIIFEALTGSSAETGQDLLTSIGYLDGSLNGIVIGVPYGWIEQEWPISVDLRRSFDQALEVLVALGADVRPIELPRLQLLEDAKKIIAASELYTSHGPVLQRDPRSLGRSFRVRMGAGAFISAQDYLNAQRWRRKLAIEMQEAFRSVEILALPTGEPARMLEEGAPEAFLANFGFHAAFNMSGNPALATRMGFNQAGLPYSLQIVGRLGADRRVLNVGHQYERATSWAAVRPVLTGSQRKS